MVEDAVIVEGAVSEGGVFVVVDIEDGGEAMVESAVVVVGVISVVKGIIAVELS